MRMFRNFAVRGRPRHMNLNLKIQLHTVVRKLHVSWQGCIGCLMRQVVTNMSKKSSLWFEAFYNAQRILNRRVCRMRNMAQRIQKKNVEILQFCQRRFRDAAVICQISRAAKTKAINFCLAVDHRDGIKARTKEFNRPTKRLEFDLRQAAEFVIRVEDIAERTADEISRCWPRV